MFVSFSFDHLNDTLTFKTLDTKKNTNNNLIGDQLVVIPQKILQIEKKTQNVETIENSIIFFVLPRFKNTRKQLKLKAI